MVRLGAITWTRYLRWSEVWASQYEATMAPSLDKRGGQ